MAKTRVQRDAIATARLDQGLSVAEIVNAAHEGQLGGLPAFVVSQRTVNRIVREAQTARERERQDKEFTAKVEPIVRRVVAEYMAARERPKTPPPAEGIGGMGGLLDRLVAAERDRPEEDRGGRHYTAEDELAAAIGPPAPPDGKFSPVRTFDPAPEPPDPEAAWREKITASIQAIAEKGRAEADRKRREAQAELEAKLGTHEKRDQPTTDRRKSGTVNAITGERYWTR